MADVFRKQYRELTAGEKASIEAVKTKAEELYGVIGVVDGTTFSTRAAALAKTKLEESVFWATKAVTG